MFWDESIMGPRPEESWSTRLAPVLTDSWHEARRALLRASRNQSDLDTWFTRNDADHMGDPAQEVDQHMHQYLDSMLKQAVPGIQVFGEEQPLRQALLNQTFQHAAFIDPIDGSAAAWSLPGGWGQVVVIQKFINRDSDGTPHFQLLYAAVVDAEGGITEFEISNPYVTVNIIDQGFSGGEAYDSEISYSGGSQEITGNTTVLIGGYKPKPSWWTPFVTLRAALLDALPSAQVFNIAGAPTTRKVIQNADNVVVQVNSSTLWDGIGALLVAKAGGTVIRFGSLNPLPTADILQLANEAAYIRSPDGKLTEARPFPPFIAGMSPERVFKVAEQCTKIFSEIQEAL